MEDDLRNIVNSGKIKDEGQLLGCGINFICLSGR